MVADINYILRHLTYHIIKLKLETYGIKVTLDGTVDSIYKELGNTDYAFYHGTMRLVTKKLKRIIMERPDIRSRFSLVQIKDIEAEKEKISGLIWHHYEELDGESPISSLWMRSCIRHVRIPVAHIPGTENIWYNNEILKV